jgi:hypothetical protein
MLRSFSGTISESARRSRVNPTHIDSAQTENALAALAAAAIVWCALTDEELPH